jgi:predicted amino acid dehydrogenase
MKIVKGPGSVQFLEGPFRGPLAVFFVGMKSLRQIKFAVPKYEKKIDLIYEKPECEWERRLAGFRRTFVDPVITSFALKVIGKIDMYCRLMFRGTMLIVFVPFLPEDCQSPELSEQMVAMLKKGVQQYYELGVRIFVLGGHTSGANAAAQLYSEFKEKDLLISHGGYATAVFNKHAIKNVFGRSQLKYAKDPVLTVVGAGAVGRPTVQANARLFDKTYVVARNEQRLKNAVDDLRESTGLDKTRIIDVTNGKINVAISAADMAVLAANVQDNRQLKINPAVYADGKYRVICDAGEPSNLSEEIAKLKEVIAFDGGVVRVPRLSKVDDCCEMVFGSTSKKLIFACSGEAFMWLCEIGWNSVKEHFVAHNLNRQFLVGPTHDSTTLDYVESRCKYYGLKLASFQRGGVILSRDELKKLRMVGQRTPDIVNSMYELTSQLVGAP